MSVVFRGVPCREGGGTTPIVGKMVIIFSKITVILISFAKDTLVGSKTEIIFISFNKNTLIG